MLSIVTLCSVGRTVTLLRAEPGGRQKPFLTGMTVQVSKVRDPDGTAMRILLDLEVGPGVRRTVDFTAEGVTGIVVGGVAHTIVPGKAAAVVESA